MTKINTTATRKCGHTVTKAFTNPGSLVAIHWRGRMERSLCKACHLAALDDDLAAIDLETLLAVVRKCHNVPRLVQLLHKAADECRAEK